MSQLHVESSLSLDESLVMLLGQHLDCNVRHVRSDMVPGADQGDLPASAAELLEQAVCSTPQVVVGRGATAESKFLAIRLPLGGVAIWEVESQFADRSASHAATLIAFHETRVERDQLRIEAEALAGQVAHDFEELSLIRALASSMEISSDAMTRCELVLRSLRPLAGGLGAESIAAVFLGDDSTSMSLPCWSGSSLASPDFVHRLISQHRFEAERQPVVRNDVDLSDRADPTSDGRDISEFVMVQCRSEGRLHGWFIACNRLDHGEQELPWAQIGFSTIQASLLETTTHQLAAQLHSLRLLRQKENLFTEVVRALVNAVEARDPYTSGHSERVAIFARMLAESIELSSSDCERIYLTGLLHDVGKIAVPDGVLRKPGSLDEDERAIIETHTEAGWRILHELEALREVLPGVLYHHERFDGKGYPDGLAGEAIPLDGRILAVCDAFDAMTSDRPYRAGMSVDRAIEIIQDGAGRFWDPHLVDRFVARIEEVDRIRTEHRPRKPAQRRAPISDIGGSDATCCPSPTLG